MSSERRLPGWALPAGLGALVVGLVAIALLRGPVDLDPDSPEGAVQEYLQALNEERWDDAVEIVHEDWRGACDGSDIQGFTQGDFTAELGSPGGPVGFVESRSFVEIGEESGTEPPSIPEDVVNIDVTISHDDAGGLGGGWQEYVVFELVDDGDFWWIVGDPWPYFVWNCRAN